MRSPTAACVVLWGLAGVGFRSALTEESIDANNGARVSRPRSVYRGVSVAEAACSDFSLEGFYFPIQATSQWQLPRCFLSQ